MRLTREARGAEYSITQSAVTREGIRSTGVRLTPR